MHRVCPDHLVLPVLHHAFGWTPRCVCLVDRIEPTCEVCADSIPAICFDLAAGDLAESNDDSPF